MIRILSTWILILACLKGVAAEPEAVSFNRDVRPILSNHCFACHGIDEAERQADLRLDALEGATADLGGYRALVPGDPKNSVMWQRIVSDDEDEIMPPVDYHRPLDEAQKQTLKRWIEEGAAYENHWSFITPEKPPVPEVADTPNPIDAFLRARMLSEGLNWSEVADKETLIRRVTLDLTGLPPTPAEVQAFLDDPREDAYERLVDDLQNRQTYGEHMARYWLDLARYADTHGLHLDNERSMWPYRDWVVRAINQNLPFDEFTRWQLAGDLLESPTKEQLIASGFNRCNVSTSEGGSINEEWIYRYAVDRTSTMAEVWMGLTAGCAVCHDHKFDPLSTREYYSMYAFFHSAADPAMDGNRVDTPPILKLIASEDEAKQKELRSAIDAVDRELNEQLLALEYKDPALADPKPEPELVADVWFEDAFPSGVTPEASGGPALELTTAEQGPVFSGTTAIRRKADDVVAQDFFSKGANFTVPENGQFFVHCFLDPEHIPQTIMVQFHTNSWKNRAVWGKQEKIPFGKEGTTEKVHLGDLPKKGEWVRLEMSAKELGLKPGTKITGFAFTQFGGTVSWDHFGVEATIDQANDPAWSWKLWSERDVGQIRKDLPDSLRRLLQGRKAKEWTEEETEQVRLLWLGEHYAGARDIVGRLEAKKAPLQKQIDEIEKAAPLTMVMADLPKPRESFVMIRGAYDARGDKVSRNVPSFLPALPQKPEGQLYDRLDLADWLLSREHPLTSRVTVNRFWQQFFGVGLVETSADFGTQGMLPSHPELLDWLALQFIDDGWDMKKLVKRIVTSHAYRQLSHVTPEMLKRDPGNRLLARAPRLRLDAEVLRDQALFLSGLLVDKIGGPGVKPYQPDNIWEPVGFGNSNTRYYKQDSGESLYRRSLYTFLKRTAPPPFMSTFDAPNREQSCSVRGRSNTPMQALQLMNDVQHVEAARGLATRMILEGGKNDSERLNWAWNCVLGRAPVDEEITVIRNAWKAHLAKYEADEQAAMSLIGVGESKPDPAINPSQLAAYTMIANLLLNLDETVNKN